MNIVFIHQNFPGQFKHLAPALASSGHQVLAIGINKPAYPTPGVKVILHRPQYLNDKLPGKLNDELQDHHAKILRGRSVANVLTKLKREGFVPDVICAHSGWGEAYFIKDVFPQTPLLVYAEYYYGGNGGDAHFDPEFFRQSLADDQRLRLKNTHLLHALIEADCGLSPTLFQRDRHPSGLRDKIRVIHDGIDTNRFRPNPDASVSLKQAGLILTKADEVITFVARELEPYRGYHIFMRALPRLLELRPQAQVVIVGGSGVSYGAPPPEKKSWKDIFYREIAGQIDPKRVHFVGKVPHQNLTQLLQISSAHVYLTYPFVLSWSMMEAMSIGCLIIGSKTAPVEEFIEHEKTGLLVNFFSPMEIADTVAEALKNRDKLQAICTAARNLIVAQYDLQMHSLPRQVAILQALGGKQCQL
ncbi:MAG: glycosyl transferase group 1 [Proteobacteria bacterium]|nr:glycosyl transferase group 1 [Pseudomonadota bacterium]